MTPDSPLTKRQRRALSLLARGGARYGTMHDTMLDLSRRGLAVAHDKGAVGHGRWVWRPTPAGMAALRQVAPDA